jgi:hypothetical protein
MSRIGKKIEDIMSAISFAEEGEFDTAKEIIKKEKRVLLAVRDGRIDRKTLKYTLNTCKRIAASLDMLFVSEGGSDIPPILRQFQSELDSEGIKHSLISKQGCLKKEIISHTNAEKDIVFAVIESTEHLDIECRGRDKKLSELWQSLKCPLVVVMDGAK